MSESIRRCDDDGFFKGSVCPECDSEGDFVCTDDERNALSRFMTWALRHEPSTAGIELDSRGWTAVDSLVEAARREHNEDVTGLHLAAVVTFDEKGRFDVNGNSIRAAYAHDDSLDVTISDKEGVIPPTLYHGTAPRNEDAIMEEGLKPMGRAAVHLTDDKDDAIDVGNRHAADGNDPVLFIVDVSALEEAGHTVSKKGKNVYTVNTVPPEYLTVQE